MTFFSRFNGKNRSRSMTESQVRSIISRADGDKSRDPLPALPQREYATVKNTKSRSKTNFRPLQHNTIAELDDFFGGSSSGKKAAEDAANHVIDSETGKVWYDSIEQQEWRTLLHGSPSTPHSRRSSYNMSGFFFGNNENTPTGGAAAAAGWMNTGPLSQMRRRSIHSPFRSTAGGANSGASTVDNCALLSPLSEGGVVGHFDNSPFTGVSLGSPRVTRRAASTGPDQGGLPMLQTALGESGTVRSPNSSSSDVSPVTLDLGSTSPFFLDTQRRGSQSQLTKKPLRIEPAQSSRSLRAALGLDRTSPSSSTFPRIKFSGVPSTPDGQTKANRRRSATFTPSWGSPSKARQQQTAQQEQLLSQMSPFRLPDTGGDAQNKRQGIFLPSDSATLELDDKATATSVRTKDGRLPEGLQVARPISVKTALHSTPVIQPVPTQADLRSRARSRKRSLIQPLRRSSSTGILKVDDDNKSRSNFESGNTDSLEPGSDFMLKTTKKLEDLVLHDGAPQGSSSSSAGRPRPQSQSLPPIRLPPVISRRFARLQPSEGQVESDTVGAL
ncbi:hypothetical protein OC846_001868 [Tilletia horrida]|uniref:Uncharacterized protein n=1 Tax=Tilletia horrida TaxID=155126 RepID=A0AAN6GS91_9BASI|nr:hypothetical protein OC846_001868 [Tilletia horrida]